MKSELRLGTLLLVAVTLVPGAAAMRAVAADSGTSDATDLRVNAMLQQLTLHEKIDLISGDGRGMNIEPLERIGLPSLHMTDGPAGTRSPAPAVAYPASIALAASFDTALARQLGEQLGRDARARGAHFLLGPGMNIYRTPLNGRNFEYFGEDPWLAGRMTVGYVEGVQSQGVSATLKHFAGNNSEYARNTSDSRIDERTLREIYLPAFEAGVKEAHAGAIMDGYNKLNGQYMTANGRLNDEIARQQWGFDGVIMSDWGATHDTLSALMGGMDLEMPNGTQFSIAHVEPLIQQGKLAPAVIDDKLRHILRLAVRFGWLQGEQRKLDIPRDNPEGRDVALQEALEGVVLLKNSNALLPLDATHVKNIAILGPHAEIMANTGGGSGAVTGFETTSLVTTLSDAVRPFGGHVVSLRGVPSLRHVALRTRLHHDQQADSIGLWTRENYSNDSLSGAPDSTVDEGGVADSPMTWTSDDDGDFVRLPTTDTTSQRGPLTGSIRHTSYYSADHGARYTLFMRNRSADRLYVDGQLVIDSWNTLPAALQQASVELTAGWHRIVIEEHTLPGMGFGRGYEALIFGAAAEDTLVDPAAVRMAASADVVILMLGFDATIEGEGADRGFQLPPGQERLVQEVLARNSNVIVVLSGGGSMDIGGFIDGVPAVLQSWYPGQEGATALTQLLLGRANPSGRLPISWERKLADNPSFSSYYYDNPQSQRIDYKNGVFVGYRGFDRLGTQPLFPFGFGLSYTSFRYSGLNVHAVTPPGSSRPLYEVAFEVRNTGTRAGADVAQLYLSDLQPPVPRPLKELKAFQRVALEPGESRHVTLRLDARSFCYFEVSSQHWKAARGVYGIQISRSAADPQLSGTVQLGASLDLPP